MSRSKTIYDVIVVGGGASGMMAAGTAAAQGKKVLLLEKNEHLGEKLHITGGGRCNITNAEEDTKILLAKFGDAAPYLHSPFATFGVPETFQFFESRKLPLVVEANKRAFPHTHKAADVVRVLEQYVADGKVEVRTNIPVVRIVHDGTRIASVMAQGFEFFAHTYIFATGGVSHPETGSTGDGFSWLADLGHTVIPPTPTIVPLKVSNAWVRTLSGTTLPDAKITFFQEGKRQFSVKGNILLTHFGLSGPTILNAAGKVADLLYEGDVTATIDLFPQTDLGILDQQIVALFEQHKNKFVRNTLSAMLPGGSTETILSLVPSLPEDIKVHNVTKEHRRALVEILKALPVSVTGLMGFDKAVVADGGVPLDEVDMRTMRSKKIENLFLTGDLLHITRPSGGYSLQLCWTTGYIAGMSL